MSHVAKSVLCQDDSASDSRAAFPPSANSKNDSHTRPSLLIGYPTSAQFVIHDKATHRPSTNFWKVTLRTAWRTAILDNNFHTSSISVQHETYSSSRTRTLHSRANFT